MTDADAAASLRSSIAPANLPLISALLACAIAQFLKPFTTWLKDKKWDSRRMLSSGGMPSSHSATVTALATAIGLQEGVGAASFAIAVVLACVVMYDATGIRLHAGRQAEGDEIYHIREVPPYDVAVRLHIPLHLLNQIVCELPPEHPVANVRPLRDSLGHTPLQVTAGALFGCVVAFILRSST